MARRKAGDKKGINKKNRAASENVPNVQADNYSLAFEKLEIGGDVGGDIRIGHTIGYTADQVSVLLKQITTTLQPKPFDGRCPYKGLEVFEEEDAELFFGRERLVNELVGRVKESRTVFITGPSGSGKSSLVRAGLIHALKQGAIKGSDRWLYETLKPGREPLKDLALAFSRLKSPELQDYFLARINETDIFNKCAESVLSSRKDQRFLLFVDQFEEVFTQINSEEERVAFINMLAHAGTIENGRVIVLFAMRSDFVSNCATYPALNELLSQEFRQIGAMQPHELVSAIAQPALSVGLRIEPELIAQIINDMQGEPGALPLMQFALKDLFDAKQAEGGVITLTLADYLKHGGIHKSLERHADATFAKLSENEQELTRSIFSGLIEIGRGTQDTKRTALFDELIPANTKAADVLVVVQKLADARLIITDEQAGKDTVTISHERLIEAWPWLKKLVNENRDAIALQNEIASDAKEWEDHNRDESYLYSGARLANAREQLDARKLVLSSTAHEFVQAGINAFNADLEAKVLEESRKRRLQRRIVIGSISFATVIFSLLVFALIQLNEARALQLGAQAEAAFAEQNYNAAALYAYQSNQIKSNVTANRVLDKLPFENFELGSGLLGNTWRINRVAWSVDGQLASASDDDTIIIWDLSNRQPIQTLEGHVGEVTDLAWSSDGRLASGSQDINNHTIEVIVWDLSTGKPSHTLYWQECSPSCVLDIVSVAWSAEGQLASSSYDQSVIIWDLSTGKPSQVLQLPQEESFPPILEVTSLAWSPDGRLASGTTGSTDNSITIWDPSTNQPPQILRGHTSAVMSVAWSADGRLASGSADNSVIIWDPSNNQPDQILRGHTSPVSSVAWSLDGHVASGSTDNSIIIWDLATEQPTRTLRGHTAAVTSVAWSAKGRLASGSDDGSAIIWNLSGDQHAQTLRGHTDEVVALAWSPNGRLASGSTDHSVIIWDLATGQPAQILRGHTGDVTSVDWSPDGRLASGSDDKSVIIWDLTNGQPAQILRGHTGDVMSVDWSPDGRLASGSADESVIIWDLSAGKPAQSFQGHTLDVRSVAWSADGRLASGSTDHSIIIWDLATGQPAQTFQGEIVRHVAWSTDGRLASSSHDSVIIWDLFTGKPALTLRQEWPFINSIAWSADGELASVSFNSINGTMITIWDLSTGKPARSIRDTDEVYDLAWSADGRLASSLGNNVVKIPRADIIGSKSCDWIYRNMTISEWIQNQGRLYIYQPACPNLPVPFIDPVQFPELTWQGRIRIVGTVLVLFAILAVILRILSKLTSLGWRKMKILFRKKSSNA